MDAHTITPEKAPGISGRRSNLRGGIRFGPEPGEHEFPSTFTKRLISAVGHHVTTSRSNDVGAGGSLKDMKPGEADLEGQRRWRHASPLIEVLIGGAHVQCEYGLGCNAMGDGGCGLKKSWNGVGVADRSVEYKRMARGGDRDVNEVMLRRKEGRGRDKYKVAVRVR